MANQISTTIKTIVDILKNAFKSPQSPQTPPSPLIAIGAEFKQGLSATEIAGAIIDKKKRYGIPTTPLPSGEPNLDLIMETIRVETIVEYLINKHSPILTLGAGDNISDLDFMNLTTFQLLPKEAVKPLSGAGPLTGGRPVRHFPDSRRPQ